MREPQHVRGKASRTTPLAALSANLRLLFGHLLRWMSGQRANVHRDHAPPLHAHAYQLLPAQLGHFRPARAPLGFAVGALRVVVQLSVPARNRRLLLQDVPVRDGVFRLRAERHGGQCREIPRCRPPATC